MTWTNPFLRLPGAVADDDREQVAAHFGNLADPQWDLERGCALADLTDMQIIEVVGADRLTLLTTLSTQILTGMTEGDSREALFLDPHGHIRFSVAALDDGQRCLLLVDPGVGHTLVEFIHAMRFASRVEARVREDLRVLGRIVPRDDGSGGAGRAGAAPMDLSHCLGHVASWTDPWPGVVEGGASYTPAGFKHPAGARTRILEVFQADAVVGVLDQWQAAGGTAAGSIAWEALRVEDLRPRQRSEVDERALPPELDWLRTAVHLNKGCYCGQEAIARIVNLGRPPRRLVALQLDGSQAPTVRSGAPVYAGEREVGKVTSVARHADLGLMALALVRRGLAPHLELAVETDAGRIPAAQEVIVDPQGKGSASPVERPGAGLSARRLQPPTLRH